MKKTITREEALSLIFLALWMNAIAGKAAILLWIVFMLVVKTVSEWGWWKKGFSEKPEKQ